MNAWPAIVVLILSALLVPPFFDENARGFNRIYPWNETESSSVWVRKSEFFECNGLKCHGWLYRPLNVIEPRVVVAAHGFAAQKDFGIEPVISEIVKKGLAVFSFDYRTFGGSQGTSRNVIDVPAILEDWQSAVTHVLTNISKVKTDKLALWGSSFGGGHVIVTAATHPNKDRIAAVVSQVPFTDGFASLLTIIPNMPFSWTLSLTFSSLGDILRRTFALERHYVPAIGTTEQGAILATHDSLLGYSSIVPRHPIGGWQNKTAASIFLEFPFYRPVSYAKDVKAPTLLVIAEKDSLCPASAAEEMGKLIPNAVIKVVPEGHFDVYHDKAIYKLEAEFLEKHLH